MKKKHMVTKKHTQHIRIAIVFVIAFAVIAVFGFSVSRSSTRQPNVGTSRASSTEPADINNDNKVDVLDLSILLGKWRTSDSLSDLNKDGTVSVFDLSILLARWGVVAGAAKPSASNTGVPAGQTLTAPVTNTTTGITVASNGNVTISKSGVFSNLQISGRLHIKAANVTVKNSRILGTPNPYDLPDNPTSAAECSTIPNSGNTAAVLAIYNYANFILEDSEVNISRANILNDGIRGSNMTIRRVEISNGIDGIGIYKASGGDAATIVESSYIRDLYIATYSPDQSCGKSHNDGIQIHFGSNIQVKNSTILAKNSAGAKANAAIMVNENGYPTSGVTIDGNWLDYGGCSLNIARKSTNGGIANLTVQNNKFGKNQSVITGGQPCGMLIDKLTYALAGNVFKANTWEDGSTPNPAYNINNY